MASLLKRLTLLLAIVSQVTLGVGRGMVLCVESDGSVQLEIASVACCEPAPLHELHEEGEQETCSRETGDCGGCTDQALQMLEVPKSKHSLPSVDCLPSRLVTVWSPPERIECVSVASRPNEPRLACLRTVVLRC